MAVNLSKTQALLQNFASGTGAVKLNPRISKVTLTYTIKGRNGTIGAKRFVRDCLPRLKYHNPNVQFLLNKLSNYEPPQMTIEFVDEQTKTISIERVFEGEDLLQGLLKQVEDPAS